MFSDVFTFSNQRDSSCLIGQDPLFSLGKPLVSVSASMKTFIPPHCNINKRDEKDSAEVGHQVLKMGEARCSYAKFSLTVRQECLLI